MGNLFGNTLFYGDNLPILRAQIDTESVDLVYLDPPFNSQQNYNVLFRNAAGDPGSAQVHAFDDTWHWGSEAEKTYHDLIHGESAKLGDLAEALRTLVGTSDMLAYLVMMAPRLVELRRVLKPTGSLYLHCDPTSSHYLKMLLDAIFGPRNFRNEIIWQRTGAKGLMTSRLPTNHDVILAYGKTDRPAFNRAAAFVRYDEADLDKKTADKYRYRDPDGRRYRLDNLINPNPNRPNLTYEFMGVTRVWRWTRERMQEAYDAGLIVQSAPGRTPAYKRYLDEQLGKSLGDVWYDIPPLNSQAAERLGFPTQKPVALMERVIAMSSNPGDLVLDPFCGCGTTVDAAQKLDRRWIGVDISYLAIDIIDKRMRKTYGESIAGTYEVRGTPRDIEGARALAVRDKFEFERWAVSLVGAQPNAKQVGDKGVDGYARFTIGPKEWGRIIVSVKGGANNPGFVRDLAGTVAGHRAAMGIMVTLNPPTKGMLEAAATSGVYTHPNGHQYARVQIVTVAQLLKGERPNRPPMMNPYGSDTAMVEVKVPAEAVSGQAKHKAAM